MTKTIRRWRRTDKGKASLKKAQIKWLYGLTAIQYASMFANQKGLCFICGKPETWTRNGKVRTLSVDHCHITRKIRALLCGRCNTGIGKFMNNPILLRATANYLDHYEGN